MLSGLPLLIGIRAQEHLGIRLVNLELLCLVMRLGTRRIIELLLHKQVGILRLQALDRGQLFQRQRMLFSFSDTQKMTCTFLFLAMVIAPVLAAFSLRSLPESPLCFSESSPARRGVSTVSLFPLPVPRAHERRADRQGRD